MNATKNKGGIKKVMATRRETRLLKSKAKVKMVNKADMIRGLLQGGKTPSEVKKILEKKGYSIYASEIYGARQRTTVAA